MTEKLMSATERQAAQLEGSTDAYEERVRKQIADDRARFEPASQATRRQAEALGRSHARRTATDAEVDARLDAALRAKGIDPDELD